MPAEGMVATCDRQRAVHRDDVGFLTWDHPLVTGAMDLLLGSETGNCAFGVLPSAGERTLLLELIFVLEPIAAPRLHVDRFLPATPIRVLINHKLEGVGRLHPSAMFEGKLQKGSPYKLIENADLSRRTIPGMLKRASTLAETQAATLRQTAQDEMVNLLGHEVSRLKTLMLVNDHIRPEELKLAEEQQEQLASAIRQSRLRLDSLRLIWKGPPEALR
jgi:ATP-dependent helicase HepA